MKLSSYKDPAGVQLQAFADILAAKCQEQHIAFIFLFVDPKLGAEGDDGMAMMANIPPMNVPAALRRILKKMKEKPEKVGKRKAHEA